MNAIKHWALCLHTLDNVATLLDDVQSCDIVYIKDLKGEMIQKIEVFSPIPQGHKIALKEILYPEVIIKYGEIIGSSTREIHIGEWIHVHNLESQRGRGDLGG